MIQILTNWCKISAKWSLFCPKPKGSQLCWGVSDVRLGTSSQHLAQHSHKEPWAVVYMGAYYGVGSTEPPQCRAHHIKTSTNVELSRKKQEQIKGIFRSINGENMTCSCYTAFLACRYAQSRVMQLLLYYVNLFVGINICFTQALWLSWEIDPYIWYNFKFVAFKSYSQNTLHDIRWSKGGFRGGMTA